MQLLKNLKNLTFMSQIVIIFMSPVGWALAQQSRKRIICWAEAEPTLYQY